MHLLFCEDAHASVFEMIMVKLVSILSFKFVDLVNKTILIFHYCTTLINYTPNIPIL